MYLIVLRRGCIFFFIIVIIVIVARRLKQSRQSAHQWSRVVAIFVYVRMCACESIVELLNEDVGGAVDGTFDGAVHNGRGDGRYDCMRCGHHHGRRGRRNDRGATDIG